MIEPFPGTEPHPDGEEPDLMEQLLEVGRGLRENHDQFNPVITWQPVSGGPAIMTGMIEQHDTTDSFDETFMRLRKLTGAPDWFAVTLDAYARDQEGEQPQPEPGSLHQAFLDGDSGVFEQLVVILMDPSTGDLVMVRQVYRWTPVDGWEWDEPQIVDSPDDAVCTAVRAYR